MHHNTHLLAGNPRSLSSATIMRPLVVVPCKVKSVVYYNSSFAVPHKQLNRCYNNCKYHIANRKCAIFKNSILAYPDVLRVLCLFDNANTIALVLLSCSYFRYYIVVVSTSWS